jgi:D-alanyl-D-alanine carboxypeptidase/D-alanyl-D-alanine-endopeptidase (penicillin-binding protein 4)
VKRPRRPARAAAALALLGAGLAPGPAQALDADPELVTGLDGVVALSPPDTCLRVDLDGTTIYRHRADQPLIPASTRKLVVGLVALDTLGAEHRYRTVVTGAEPVDGVVAGDLALVGGGDPLLATATDAFVRRIADQPLTYLDELADALVARGVRHVTGGVVGDETRYDTARTVAGWPERYATQEQVGPLSALTVDDGYMRTLPSPGTDGVPERTRAAEPATAAAEALIDLLRARGVRVDGPPSTAGAPTFGNELAAVESAPLTEIVRQLLEESDNGTGELLVKEIGHRTGGGGTTAAGTAHVERRAAELGFPVAGTDVTDGSGLDRANRTTCDELVAVLEHGGGSDGAIGAALPVAGRTGTLESRFEGTPAEGRLRAKTGSLNGVTSLAGFVDLPDGTVATFAYVANGPQADDPRRGQDFLGVLLGQYEDRCPDEAPDAVVAPLAAVAIDAAPLAPVPLAPVVAPGLLAALHAVEANPDSTVHRCASDPPTLVLRTRA